MTDAQPSAAERKKSQIERINELSNLARIAWFSLLAYLVFVGITLLGVEDADFFLASRRTQLPLVGVEIPTAKFFLTAPVLGAALYTYLHLFLVKLWDAHAEARTNDGDPTHHWLVNDFVLIRQGDPVARARPLAWLTSLINRLLVWIAGPFVLAYAWWRSMPAHDEWMTLLIALCLGFTLYVGFTSWFRADQCLGHPWRTPWEAWWQRAAAVLVVLLLLVTSWLRTERGLDHYLNRLIDIFEVARGPMFDPARFRDGSSDPPPWVQKAWVNALLPALPLEALARTDLDGVDFVLLPDDWRTHGVARAAFRKVWCDSRGLTMAVCSHLETSDRSFSEAVLVDRLAWCAQHEMPNAMDCSDYFIKLDFVFEKEWAEERDTAIRNLSKTDLSGRDLRGAAAAGVSLVGAIVDDARLDGASLVEAQLEAASFDGASLTNADLRRVQMEDADLTDVDLRGAELLDASLARSRLVGARMQWSRAPFANLDGADVMAARLRGVRLGSAQLRGTNLTLSNLDLADLSVANLEGARLGNASLVGAMLRGANLSSTTLFHAQLVGSDLRFARLDRAGLESTNLNGSDLTGADARSSGWGAVSGAFIVIDADLRGVQRMTQTQLELAVGNVGTLLPDYRDEETGERFYVWNCWEQLPPDFEFKVRTILGEFVDLGTLREEFLCGRHPRHKTGTPLGLYASYPDGHALADHDD